MSDSEATRSEMNNSDFDSARHALDDLSRVVAAFRREMREGARVSLDGLPEATSALCGRVAALPREEGLALVPGLAVLVGEVDALGEQVRAEHARLAAQVASLETQNGL